MLLIRSIFIFLFVLCGRLVLAQSTRQDSITHHYDSLAKVKLNKTDSSNNGINNKIDATQSRINKLLNPNLNQLITKDKIEKRKQSRDSIQFNKKLGAQKKAIKNKIDSLEKMQLLPGRYALQLDSLDKMKYTPGKNQSRLNRWQLANKK